MKKHTRKMAALLLCLALVLSLIGCTKDPAALNNSEESTAPAETEPLPQDIYGEARKTVDDAQNLRLIVTISESRTVGSDVYTDEVTQRIAFQGLGTDTLIATAESDYSCCGQEFSTEEYYNGTKCFLTLDEQSFSSKLTQEDYLARFTPAVLVDSSLYGSVIATEVSSGSTELTFSDPSDGEAWAMPEYAELVSASGSAVLNADGELTSTSYAIEYTLGAIHVELEITSEVQVREIMALTNPLSETEEDYVALEYIDAPLLLNQALHNIQLPESVTFSDSETIISAAAAVYYSTNISYDIYGTGEDLLAKIDNNIVVANLSNGRSESTSSTKKFKDGKYFIQQEEGEPVRQLVSATVTEVICRDALINSFISPENLASAKISDLGSVYLLEMTGSEVMAEGIYRDTLVTLFQDDNLLDENSEAYELVSMDMYLSIDKFTELPVAYGYYYEGNHTIQGNDCLLSAQKDFGIFLSSNESYEAVTEELLPDKEPENKPTPLFYHVTGENGQEMWLFGTIHLGDDRTAYLPQEIYTALETSDALAVEFDTDAFYEQLEDDEALQDQVYSAYFYEDESETKTHLDEKVYEDAVKMLKATGNYHPNCEYMKPYLWSQSIEHFYLQQGYDLQYAKGVDNRLLKIAREKEIKILDIESGEFQTQMINDYSDELQQLILEETLNSTSLQYMKSIRELYELWCQGDEAALRKELSDEVDTSELTEEELEKYEQIKDLLDQYNTTMSYDRNAAMLDAAVQYLESGETVFYAVGLAHLVDNMNGLVDALREAGYTVELVEYI